MRITSVVAVVVCLLGSVAREARAQATAVDQSSTPAVSAAASATAPARPIEFLSRFDFHISAAAMKIDDPRFAYDGHIGGDLDLVDYGKGRLTFLADYEPVMGSELRFFDPNQGNYTLESMASGRVGSTEIGFVFHHVSRHLGDRAKLFSVAWNEVGVRAMHTLTHERRTLTLQVDAGRILQHNFVDYTWLADLNVKLMQPVSPRAFVFARGEEQIFAVDASKAGRSTQNGGTIEAGVHLNGKAAAVELFAGYERRIDAYPTDRATLTWLMMGFRLLNR